MSLFRDERPRVGAITITARTPDGGGTGAGKPGVPDGHIWNDPTQKTIYSQVNNAQLALVGALAVNSTPVTATNPSAAANLMVQAVSPQVQNAAGKTLRILAAGTYTTASGQTPTITFTLNEGAVVLDTWVTGATTGSATNMPWSIEAYVTTANAAGANSNVEAHGGLSATLGTNAAAAAAFYNDNTAAVSANIDFTVSQNIFLQALMSSSNAGNSVVQRQMIVEVLN